MFYRNARVFAADQRFHHGAFAVENGVFTQVLPREVPADAVDLQGATVIPGLIDVHTHGNSQADFSDGDPAGLAAMAAFLAKKGITSFLPTSMTLPYAQLEAAFHTARGMMDAPLPGQARVLGVHMEGPYFSPEKKGAQNAAWLRLPNAEGFAALDDACGNVVRIVDVAPELPGAQEFIRAAKARCTVSVAHTAANYAAAAAGFDAGATHVTHLYNAMPPLHHRDPGVIGAAVERPHVRAELICDGLHVHESAVRLAFAAFGPERMVLISDSGRCCGMAEGSSFTLGGQTAFLRGGAGRLPDGTIACSATDLFSCMRKAVSFGISQEAAIRAASYNPARAIGMERSVGSIAPGLAADFVICDDDLNPLRVFLGEEEVLP